MRRAYSSTLTVEAHTFNAPHQSGPCVWCSKDISDGDAVIEIGGQSMHDHPCRQEFGACVYGYGESEPSLRERAEDGPTDPYYNRTYAQALGLTERVVRIPVGVEL